MRRQLLLSAAALLAVMGSSDPRDGLFVSAAWTMKKLAGSQWRNGNHLIAAALGRDHNEIKGIIQSIPSVYQEQYKQIAERYADAAEAKEKSTSPANTAALDDLLTQLKGDAEALLTSVVGSPRGGVSGARQQPGNQQQGGAQGGPTPGAQKDDAILEPLQQQMLMLQQRQQQQMQQLITDIQRNQQEERAMLGQKLREAREQHIMMQREGQAVRSLIFSLQTGIQGAQGRISELARSAETIEGLTANLEAALQRVSAAVAGGGPPVTDARDLEVLDANKYIQTKAALGRFLGELNASLQNLLLTIEKAEERAAGLAKISPSGRQLSEDLLQACASLRVSLASQEEFLAEVVAGLEARQIQCDETLNRLKSFRDVAFSRYAESLKGRSIEVAQQVASAGDGLKTAVSSGAQQLKDQIESEIQRLAEGVSPLTLVAQQINQLHHYAESWNQNIDQSLASLDGLLTSAQNVVDAAGALPAAHKINIDILNQALQGTAETKRQVRQDKAKVQHLLQVLQSQYLKAMEQQQGPIPVQNLATNTPLDPYALYARPTVLASQQQGAGPGASQMPTLLGAPQMQRGSAGPLPTMIQRPYGGN